MTDQARPPSKEDVFVPLHVGAGGKVAAATVVRSTLIGGSVLALRERGHLDRYLKLLPERYHEAVMNSVAGAWLDLGVGVAHYRAANALDLPVEEQMILGRGVAARIQDSLLGTLVRAAKTAGVTPWLGLEFFPKLWSRLFQGGSVAIYRLGPKEARFEAHGIPALVELPYFRSGFRGMFTGSGELFCRKMYVQEIPTFTAKRLIGFRVSWA